jgi:peptidoglycan/LPS O-acetylase OafA/YrhL
VLTGSAAFRPGAVFLHRRSNVALASRPARGLTEGYVNRTEIRPLTGIRGVAALLVAVYHLNGFNAPPQLRVEGLAGNLVNHGYLAVDLFFVLSGYVMALSYGHMLRKWDGRNYLRFLIRRIARVYPLFAAVTLGVVVLLVTGLSHEKVDNLPRELAWNLAMLQGWGFGTSLDAPAWSISTEWGAYLIFPLLAGATLFGNRRTVVLTALAAAIAIAALAFLPFGDHGPLDIYGPGAALARCIAEFSLGLISYRIAQRPGVQAWARRPAAGLALAAAIVGLLMVPGADLAIVALLPAFIIVLGVGAGPVQRMMACTPVFFAGDISYAVYLLHTRFVRVRDTLDAHLAPVLGGLAPLAASATVYAVLILASWIAYRFLERPARSYVRRFEHYIPRESSAAPVAVAGEPAPR